MKIKIVLSIFLLVFCIIELSAKSDYYWYKGNKIPLTELPNKKYIVFEGEFDSEVIKRDLNMTDFNVLFQDSIIPYSGINYLKEESRNNRKWAIISSESIESIDLTLYEKIVYQTKFYQTEKNVEVGISHFFYVKLKTDSDYKILEKFADSNKVQILGNNKFMPMWYTLSCTKASIGNSLEIANEFFETGFFEAAEPDFMVDDLLFCANDTYFNSQWGLKNTGQYSSSSNIDINFCQANQITGGNPNVIIAVLDHGIELNHPDITNIYSISYDTEIGTSPSYVRGDHGTACAGIIGANSNNNLGITGIVPNCQLMSISNKLKLSLDAPQKIANGLNFAWQNGADVISNSWGSNALQSSFIDDAIDNALAYGRNGLGCVVVFASGNDNGSITYPANSNEDIIVVGAMSPCGERKNPNSCDGEGWGSNYGSTLDVIAPGVLIPTTDRQGNDGYNPNIAIHTSNGGNLVTSDFSNTDYTIWFNGTSAACPYVAGVAGLILSKNTHITNEQVADIIESTAQKVGGYSYQTTSGRPNGTWDDEVGYGLVDAYAALLVCPTTTLTNQAFSTDTEVIGCEINVSNTTISNNAELIIDSENNITIEHDFQAPLGTTLELK